MHCKNCKKQLSEAQNYCDNCGAKIIRNRLTPKALVHQINQEFWTIDNKFLKTFVDLFKKPETVINGYIDGTRKKYVNVIQYFAIALTLAGIQAFLMTTFFKDALEIDMTMFKGLEKMSSQKDNPFANFDFESQSKYQSFIYILSVPLSAIATWLTYFIVGEKRHNFTEHIIINLYYSGQIIIISAVVTICFLVLNLNFLVASLILVVPIYYYLFYILKRVFNDSFWDAALKFILFVIIIGIVFIFLMMVFAIVTFIYIKMVS